MDQVSAVVETVHYADQRLLTTRYLSECGCEWTVDMWGNVRRVKICPRDTNDIRVHDPDQGWLWPVAERLYPEQPVFPSRSGIK